METMNEEDYQCTDGGQCVGKCDHFLPIVCRSFHGKCWLTGHQVKVHPPDPSPCTPWHDDRRAAYARRFAERCPELSAAPKGKGADGE